MKQFVFDTPSEGGDFTAQAIAEVVQKNPKALLCLAAGHSSLPVFEGLLKQQQNGVDFSQVNFVGLDEWVGVPPENEGSCANFLWRSVFTPMGIHLDKVRLFDAMTADPHSECAEVEKYIDTHGGMDFLLLGMGMNGHLALNEPGDSFDQGAHVVSLDQKTLSVAPKYFSGDMPAITHGMTLGIKSLLAAKEIHLTVFGEKKRPVVQKLIDSEVANYFPASALKPCAHATLVMDKQAGTIRG